MVKVKANFDTKASELVKELKKILKVAQNFMRRPTILDSKPQTYNHSQTSQDRRVGSINLSLSNNNEEEKHEYELYLVNNSMKGLL